MRAGVATLYEMCHSTEEATCLKYISNSFLCKSIIYFIIKIYFYKPYALILKNCVCFVGTSFQIIIFVSK